MESLTDVLAHRICKADRCHEGQVRLDEVTSLLIFKVIVLELHLLERMGVKIAVGNSQSLQARIGVFSVYGFSCSSNNNVIDDDTFKVVLAIVAIALEVCSLVE